MDERTSRPVDSAPLRKLQLERWEAYERDVPVPPHAPSSKHVGFGLGTQLLSAASLGDADDVRELLMKGAPPDAANADGLTPLHQVCIDNHKDLAELLLQAGANADARDNEGWTPLHAAVSCGHLGVLRVLLQHNANLLAVNVDEQVPLDVAREAHGAHSHVYTLLHEEMQRKRMDDTAVAAAKQVWTQAFLRLVEEECARGATATSRKIPPQGATLLHFAACHDFLDAAEKLVASGAPVDAEDEDGWTPLHAAVHWDQRALAHFLVAVGADVHRETRSGEVLADLADPSSLAVCDFITSLEREAESVKERLEMDGGVLLSGGGKSEESEVSEGNGGSERMEEEKERATEREMEEKGKEVEVNGGGGGVGKSAFIGSADADDDQLQQLHKLLQQQDAKDRAMLEQSKKPPLLPPLPSPSSLSPSPPPTSSPSQPSLQLSPSSTRRGSSPLARAPLSPRDDAFRRVLPMTSSTPTTRPTPLLAASRDDSSPSTVIGKEPSLSTSSTVSSTTPTLSSTTPTTPTPTSSSLETPFNMPAGNGGPGSQAAAAAAAAASEEDTKGVGVKKYAPTSTLPARMQHGGPAARLPTRGTPLPPLLSPAGPTTTSSNSTTTTSPTTSILSRILPGLDLSSPLLRGESLVGMGVEGGQGGDGMSDQGVVEERRGKREGEEIGNDDDRASAAGGSLSVSTAGVGLSSMEGDEKKGPEGGGAKLVSGDAVGAGGGRGLLRTVNYSNIEDKIAQRREANSGRRSSPDTAAATLPPPSSKQPPPPSSMSTADSTSRSTAKSAAAASNTSLPSTTTVYSLATSSTTTTTTAASASSSLSSSSSSTAAPSFSSSITTATTATQGASTLRPSILSRVQEAVLRFTHPRRASIEAGDVLSMRRRSSIIRTGTVDKQSIAADDRKREFRAFQAGKGPEGGEGGEGGGGSGGTGGGVDGVGIAVAAGAGGFGRSVSLSSRTATASALSTSTSSTDTTSTLAPPLSTTSASLLTRASPTPKSVAALKLAIEQRRRTPAAPGTAGEVARGLSVSGGDAARGMSVSTGEGARGLMVSPSATPDLVSPPASSSTVTMDLEGGGGGGGRGSSGVGGSSKDPSPPTVPVERAVRRADQSSGIGTGAVSSTLAVFHPAPTILSPSSPALSFSTPLNLSLSSTNTSLTTSAAAGAADVASSLLAATSSSTSAAGNTNPTRSISPPTLNRAVLLSPSAAGVTMRTLDNSPSQRLARVKRIRENRRSTTYDLDTSAIEDFPTSPTHSSSPPHSKEASRTSSKQGSQASLFSFRSSPPHPLPPSTTTTATTTTTTTTAANITAAAASTTTALVASVNPANPSSSTTSSHSLSLPAPSHADSLAAILQALQKLEHHVDDLDVLWCTHRDHTYDAIDVLRRRLAALPSDHTSDV